MIRLPQHVAARLARQLDDTRAACPDFETEARLDDAADLFDGIGCPTFVQGLKDRLADIEERLLEDAEYPDISRGRGGNDPDCWLSGRFERAVDDACDEFCREFVVAVEAAMAAVRTGDVRRAA